jgi:hypothetical protein
MSSRVFMRAAAVVVIACYLIGAVALAMQPRNTGIPAPEHLVAWGVVVMFTATLAFALAFAHAAMISE